MGKIRRARLIWMEGRLGGRGLYGWREIRRARLIWVGRDKEGEAYMSGGDKEGEAYTGRGTASVFYGIMIKPVVWTGKTRSQDPYSPIYMMPFCHI